MADLYVDMDALSELSRQLEQIKASLERAKGIVEARDHAIGSSSVEDALDEFVSGWKDGRRKIIEGIDGLLGRIQAAVEAYREQEQALSRAARGEG
jgi:hypothetical protein